MNDIVNHIVRDTAGWGGRRMQMAGASGRSAYGLARGAYKMGSSAYKHFFSQKMPPIKLFSPYATPRKSVAGSTRSLGTYSGKSSSRSGGRRGRGVAGYLKKNSYKKKASKKKSYKKKSYKKKRNNAQTSSGVSIVYETAISQQGDADAIYIGHCSLVPSRILRVISRAFVKMLLNKMGFYFNDWEDTPPFIPILAEAATVNIAFKRTPIDSLQIVTMSINQTIVGTYSDFGIHVMNNMGSIMEQIDQNGMFVYIEYVPSATFYQRTKWVRLPLANASFSLNVLSQLKIQNRTIAVAGDNDADDVDNMPVYGRSYFGYGNGSWKLNNQGTDTVPCYPSDDGIIRIQSANDEDMRSLVSKTHFGHCSSTSNFTMGSGEIKLDKLILKKSGPFSALVRLMQIDLSPITADFQVMKGGNWRLFGMDRMLDANDTVDSVRIAGELKQIVSVSVTPGRNNQTTRDTIKGVFP